MMDRRPDGSDVTALYWWLGILVFEFLAWAGILAVGCRFWRAVLG